jgi:hypothetical protein
LVDSEVRAETDDGIDVGAIVGDHEEDPTEVD